MLRTAAVAQQAPPDPAEALARAQAGNRPFRIDDPTRPDLGQARRAELARGQRPLAAVLGYADSRTAPESLFRAGLGKVFTVRAAGNSLTSAATGSLEYALEHLHAPLNLVLLPSVIQARREGAADPLKLATKLRARNAAQRLRDSVGIIAPAITAGRLSVQAAYDTLDDGEVTICRLDRRGAAAQRAAPCQPSRPPSRPPPSHRFPR